MRLLKTIVGTLYFLALSLLCSHAYAQDPADIALGVSPVATYLGGNFESVDMATGRLHVQIPLVIDHSQRGNLNFTYSAFYDSPGAWIIVSQTGHQRWVPSSKGIIGMSTGSKGFLGFSPTVYYTDPVTGNQYQFDYVKEMDGLLHPLGGVGTNLWGTIDGSGILKEISSGGQYYIFIDNSGRQFLSPALATTVPYAVQDTNGNQMSLNSSGTGVDSLGRSWTSSSTATSGCPVSASFASLWQTPGFNGGQRNFKFCYSPLTIQTQFNTPPVAEYTASITVLTGIVLPDSTTWRFDYDNYGDIWKITLPTGGTITYTWTTTHDGGCSGGNLRTVLYRAVSDGMNSSTWTYNTIISGTNSLTDPLGNVTTFQGAGCGENFIQVQYYSGAAQSGNLIKTETTTYQTLPDPYPREMKSYAQAPQLPLSTTTTWANGQVSKVAQLYDCGYFSWTDDNSGGQTYTSTCPAPSTNPAYGLVTSKTNYDYPGGSSTLSTTNTTYKALSSDSDASSYLSANLLDLTCLVTIYGPGSVPSQTSCSAPPPVQANQAAQTTYKYDESPSPTGVHGNLTSVTRWLNGGTSPKTQYSFNGYGTRITMTDPAGNLTQYTPDATGVFYNQITYPPTGSVQHVVYPTYDSNTGLITQFKDQNSQTTYYKNYDAMLRIGEIDYPDGGQTIFSYPSPTQIQQTQKITSSLSKVTTSIFDGLGRLKQTQSSVPTTTCASGYAYVDTSYDPDGRKHTVSNPDCTSTASDDINTTYSYDPLNRITSVAEQDGSVVTTDYSQVPCVTVKDEALKARKSCMDGAGRTTSVWEDPLGLNYQTSYSYDANNNLTSVVQNGSRNRGFTYDSLSRLISATNPESGTITYSYDANSNLAAKVAPQANQTGTATTTTSSCYDALNRLTTKKYATASCPLSSPDVSYSYDGTGCPAGKTCFNLGHRTGLNDAAGSETWSYYYVSGTGDGITDQRTTNNVTKSMVYTYNYDHTPASITYPSTRTITYGVNVAEQPTSAIDNNSSNPINYAGSAIYAPHGGLASVYYGPNNILSTWIYNARLQQCRIAANTSGTAPSSCGDAHTGNVFDLTYNFSLGSDNGNVASVTNNLDPTRSQAFSYDPLNRLLTAQTTGTYVNSPSRCWGESYQYDNQTSGGAWGNLTGIGGTSSSYNGCTQENLSILVGVKNQITTSGFGYDAAGNLIAAPPTGTTYSYNAENQLAQAAGFVTAGYLYDGDGKRVAKTSAGTAYKLYWYGVNDAPLSESDGSGNITDEYIFFNGKRIARRVAH